jgi:GxxExxY protein
MPNRLKSDLPPETETLVTRTIQCAERVHGELGPGYLEGIYQDAMCVELELDGLPFECEKKVVVRYRDHDLRAQKLDLVVGNQVIVELKAVSRVDPIGHAQILSYLKSTGLRVGLIMNFHERVFRMGVKRFVL